MHIAMFTDYYLPTLGGVQTLIKAEKESLEQAGHRVTIFCPLHKKSSDPSVVRLPTSKYFKPDNYPFTWPPKSAVDLAKRELAKRKVDVVHVHSEMVATVAGMIAARSLGLPLVRTMHGRNDVYSQSVLPLPSISTGIISGLHRRYISDHGIRIKNKDAYTKKLSARRMWRLMVSQANYVDQVIVPSKHFAKKLKDQGVNKPITIISNGLEDTVLKKLEKAKVRNFGKGDELKIMWCGRVSPEKRPLALLEATLYLPKNVSIDIYGDGVSIKKVSRYIKKHKFDDRVSLYGSVPQHKVLDAMSNHHLFISTSYDFDNQPMVLLEAIAAGLPVVYCDPDLAEVVPSKGSILTTSPQPKDIANAIRKIQSNPNNISRMSKEMIVDRSRTAQRQHLKPLLRVYAELLS